MKTVSTARVINAPPEAIWAVLTDANQLANGKFGIRSLEGRIAKGAALKLVAEVAPKQVFRLTVTELDPPRRMVWRGGMPFGLFKGVREFTLAPAPGGTAFTMTETFTGPLSGPITRSMPDLTPSFETFAAALAAASERQPA